MPSFKPSADLDMHYEVDDFTDPWTTPETVPLLHGNAEKRAGLVALGAQVGAALPGGAAGHARLWPVVADAAQLSPSTSIAPLVGVPCGQGS
jgi:hypothetical protein